ncbi:MAG: PQQ-like beta-propeller repeat protein [Deltaproteobacteria bacterium]|nr:PQQ-like beta-propeller repeat protein [Deltaproteobacteria bacterium]
MAKLAVVAWQAMESSRLIVGLLWVFLLSACGGAVGAGAADADTDGGGTVVLLDVGVAEPDTAPPIAALCETDADCVEEDARWCVTPGLCAQCRQDSDCGVWQRCTSGTCLSRVCKPAQALCVGDTRWTCAEGGKSWEPFRCAPGTCVDGACAACVPGSRWCSEDGVVTCDSNGQAGAEVQACAGATQCVVEQCVQCRVQGERGCVDGRAVECSAFGSWKVGEDCKASGKACSEGACIDCDPGTLHCFDQDAECTYAGKTKVLAHCLEQGSACWQGECLGLCDHYDVKQPLAVNCAAGVCCERPDGTLETTALEGCGEPAAGAYRPWEHCTVPVCCRTPDGADAELPVGTCNAGGGVELAPEHCGAPTCCMDEDLQFSVMPVALCVPSGGARVADVACETTGCCRTGPSTFVEADVDACAAASGTVTSGLLCHEPTVVTIAADVAPQPNSGCVEQPLLAVPSSGNDSVVVYNLDTLTVETAAFPVCDGPSRMVMDADTNVFVACRLDGVVVKATKDGVILWKRPVCGGYGANGVALAPDGRLFASCAEKVLELNPATGQALDSVAVGFHIYGIAADQTGVYAADRFVYKVGIDQPKLYVAWQVPNGHYGIATDGLGKVWLSGAAVTALDADDGAKLESYLLPTTAFGAGLSVGPDGLVYAAARGAGVYVVAPGVGLVRHLVTPAASSETKGVALDASGNAYAINLDGSDVTRFDAQGVATSFGGGGLDRPDPYNGDLTGRGAGCINGGTSFAWHSGMVAGPSDSTVWLDVTWEATTPPQTAIYVAWRPGPDVAWKLLDQGSILAYVGPGIEFLAHLSGTETAKPHLQSITVRYVQP